MASLATLRTNFQVGRLTVSTDARDRLRRKLEAMSPEERAAASEVVEGLFTAAAAGVELDRKTDVEVADIINRWHGETSVADPLSALLDTVMERLRRAGGGPLPEDTDG